MKFIVVTGGVVSGLGKGITISSIGRILKASGLRVTSIKIDPYLNTDAGTMSPFEHGETFVLDDGGETDLDLGNYERFTYIVYLLLPQCETTHIINLFLFCVFPSRFLDITLTGRHNITSGKIYKEVCLIMLHELHFALYIFTMDNYGVTGALLFLGYRERTERGLSRQNRADCSARN